jgi:hypothetical protein
MRYMVVTLEVLKLSSLLKADAACQVEGRACDAGGRGVRAGRREGLGCGGVGTQAACTGKVRLMAWGPRARAERTENIWYMFVTPEVSKRSGWLKADARCRFEGRACDAGGREVRAGRWEGLGCGGGTTQAACTGKRPDSKPGGQGHARSAP